jgi:hypothetical protein
MQASYYFLIYDLIIELAFDNENPIIKNNAYPPINSNAITYSFDNTNNVTIEKITTPILLSSNLILYYNKNK